MFRIKNMSRGGWIGTGFVVALLLVPSGVAVANALRYAGIEGTSLNKADVTPAGQLQVADAAPNAFFQNASIRLPTGEFDVIASPPSPFALVVTAIHININADPAPGSDELAYWVQAGTLSSCSRSVVGRYGPSLIIQASREQFKRRSNLFHGQWLLPVPVTRRELLDSVHGALAARRDRVVDTESSPTHDKVPG